jgi:hypothetical protein
MAGQVTDPNNPYDLPDALPIYRIYRHFDRCGCLLYVGITGNAVRRTRQHEASGWSFFVRRIYISEEFYSTRADAERIERMIIRAARPPFNKAFNPDYVAAVTEWMEGHPDLLKAEIRAMGWEVDDQ